MKILSALSDSNSFVVSDSNGLRTVSTEELFRNFSLVGELVLITWLDNEQNKWRHFKVIEQSEVAESIRATGVNDEQFNLWYPDALKSFTEEAIDLEERKKLNPESTAIPTPESFWISLRSIGAVEIWNMQAQIIDRKLVLERFWNLNDAELCESGIFKL